MTSAPATALVGGGRSRSRLVAVLAVTETVSYGVLYYSFAVLLTPIATDLHTSTARVSAALTISVLVAAGAALPVGRWLDRHGGRTLMTAGSALGVLAVIAWSQVRTVGQLYAVFVLIGLAGAMSLYEAAFSVLIATVDPARRNSALLAVTVVAGFASSIFFPLTATLTSAFGWRTALLILAAILAAIAIPGHLAAIPTERSHRLRARVVSGYQLTEALRDKAFWLLGLAFVLHAAAVAAVGVLLVSFLSHAGHATTIAATLAGLLGVLSVSGRLVTTALARRHGMTAVTAAVFLVQAAGAAALPHVGRSLAGAAACVAAFGLGFGVATLARPAIVAARYGTASYATIAGALSLPITLAKALAPLPAALLPSGWFLRVAAAACLVAAALLATASRNHRRPAEGAEPDGPGRVHRPRAGSADAGRPRSVQPGHRRASIFRHRRPRPTLTGP